MDSDRTRYDQLMEEEFQSKEGILYGRSYVCEFYGAVTVQQHG
jgi:hypothetical protein